MVRAIIGAVDEILDVACRLPPAAVRRPTSCPGCGHPAHGAAGLGIVGHGVYRRQVLGIAPADVEVVIPVRRFLCGGCGKTISVLPDLLHPRRWYAATAILEAVRRHLVGGRARARSPSASTSRASAARRSGAGGA